MDRRRSPIIGRWFRALSSLLVVFVATAATAQTQTDQSEKSVVRIAIVEDEPSGQRLIGTGSGFAVRPDLIVTNAHVVEEVVHSAEGGPKHAYVVPPLGDAPLRAEVLVFDPQHDLAVVRIPRAMMQPSHLTEQHPSHEVKVYALGYPGVLDEVFGKSADQILEPHPPEAFPGTVSSYGPEEDLNGTEVAIHNALISPGNSGGPLVDECGRVIGVNRATITRRSTAATYAIAVSTAELLSVLKANNIVAETDARPCLGFAAQLRRQAVEAAEAEIRAKSAQAAAPAQSAPTASQGSWLLAAVPLGALAAAGAGLMLYARTGGRAHPQSSRTGGLNSTPYVVAAIVGVALVAFILWLLLKPRPGQSPAATVGAGAGAVAYSCAFDPALSDVATGQNTRISVENGCVNGQTLFAKEGDGLRRGAVDPAGGGVSILSFNLATGQLSRAKYDLSAETLDNARRIGAAVGSGCPLDPARRGQLDQATAAANRGLDQILAGLTPERTVWRCQPTP